MTIQKQTSYHIDNTKLHTADEVAKELNVNPSLVRRYCRQGRMGQFIYGRWLISPAELEVFRAKTRKRGNPNFGKR